MNEFSQVDFGPIQVYLDNDDVTDISYSNGGQVWLKTLSKGVYRVENPAVNNAFMEKMAFQCANTMGKSFNMANPFLDAESDELRMNFVHDSIAKNGIAVLIRKTPAKIRLEKDKILKDDYIRLDIHDFLLKCVEGHCNILVSGETGSGKTEFIKYLAAHTKVDEKLITIEDTLELHLDKIFPQRDIVAMKTNNIASYADVLVTCMRQNPRWILLSEVRSAEAVMAVRDSISSGHNILSTIHAEKAESIPSRLYSLLESSIDMDQFLRSIHRYVQLGVHIKGYYSKELQRFKREVAEVVEFYVDDENVPQYKILYKRMPDGKTVLNNPSKYLLDYLESQGVIMQSDILVKESFHEVNEGLDQNSVNSFSEDNTQVGTNVSTAVNSSTQMNSFTQKNNIVDVNQVLSNQVNEMNEQYQPNNVNKNVYNDSISNANTVNNTNFDKFQSLNNVYSNGLNDEIIDAHVNNNLFNSQSINSSFSSDVTNVNNSSSSMNDSSVKSLDISNNFNVSNNINVSNLQNSVEKNNDLLYTNVNGNNTQQ